MCSQTYVILNSFTEIFNTILTIGNGSRQALIPLTVIISKIIIFSCTENSVNDNSFRLTQIIDVNQRGKC